MMSATVRVLPRIGVMMFRPAGLVKRALSRASAKKKGWIFADEWSGGGVVRAIFRAASRRGSFRP